MASRSDLLRLLVRLIGPALLVVVVWRLDDKAALWSAVKEVHPLLFAGRREVPDIEAEEGQVGAALPVHGHR
jgi:hypothetical protein